MIRYISLFLTLAAAGCARLAPVPSTVPDLPGLPESQEAPAAFDFASNGVVDDATHQADRTALGLSTTRSPAENAIRPPHPAAAVRWPSCAPAIGISKDASSTRAFRSPAAP